MRISGCAIDSIEVFIALIGEKITLTKEIFLEL